MSTGVAKTSDINACCGGGGGAQKWAPHMLPNQHPERNPSRNSERLRIETNLLGFAYAY
jgi:hypothetical protein